ncbi:TrmH family RNA methyltransferase [Candidatus Saccharibacteria bacterium]|nr:TrmH family RNA methyltransferase [Candidatus Saccharibacteria bacterium]
MELVLVLHNIRSVYNVGAILRSFEGFGGKRAIFSGYTPYPGLRPGVLPHIAEKIQEQVGKTALGAEKMVALEWTPDIIGKLRSYKRRGYKIVELENNLRDKRLHPLNEFGLKDKLGGKIVLVLGEEVHGIPEDVRKEADAFVEIPMRGRKESFNVSVAAGIALYQLMT